MPPRLERANRYITDADVQKIADDASRRFLLQRQASDDSIFLTLPYDSDAAILALAGQPREILGKLTALTTNPNYIRRVNGIRDLTTCHSTEGYIGNILLQNQLANLFTPDALPTAAKINEINDTIFKPLAEINEKLNDNTKLLLIHDFISPLPAASGELNTSSGSHGSESSTDGQINPKNPTTLLYYLKAQVAQNAIRILEDAGRPEAADAVKALIDRLYVSLLPQNLNARIDPDRPLPEEPRDVYKALVKTLKKAPSSLVGEHIGQLKALYSIGKSLRHFTDSNVFLEVNRDMNQRTNAHAGPSTELHAAYYDRDVPLLKSNGLGCIIS